MGTLCYIWDSFVNAKLFQNQVVMKRGRGSKGEKAGT